MKFLRPFYLVLAAALWLADPAAAATSWCSNLSVGGTGPCSLVYPTPGGRITDSTTSCTHVTDSAVIQTLYYLPCANNYIPISTNATSFSWYVIPSTSTTLSTADTTIFTASTIFDFYATISSGSVVYCAVKWGTSTAGASSRGSSAAITTLSGITVNNYAANCYNSTSSSTATTYTLTIGEATLLGSFVITATAADVAMQFLPTAAAGGPTGGCWIGYANIYNQASAICTARDSTSSPWTYGTASWEALDAGATGSGLYNRVYWVDPLGTSNIAVEMLGLAKNATAANEGAVGIGINSTSAVSGIIGANGAVTTYTQVRAMHSQASPQAGFNYAQALQYGNATANVSFLGSGYPTGQNEGLTLGVLY